MFGLGYGREWDDQSHALGINDDRLVEIEGDEDEYREAD